MGDVNVGYIHRTQTYGVGMLPGRKRADYASHDVGFRLDPPAPIPTRLLSRSLAGQIVENGWVPVNGSTLGRWVQALRSMTWTWLAPAPPGCRHPERTRSACGLH